jgi:hypothetical protein
MPVATSLLPRLVILVFVPLPVVRQVVTLQLPPDALALQRAVCFGLFRDRRAARRLGIRR